LGTFELRTAPPPSKHRDRGHDVSYYLTDTGTGTDTTTIVVAGELDASAAPALRAALGRAIEARVSEVIVDLTETTFVDSTAIGALLAASKQVRESEARLEVICTNPNVLGIFEIVGLDQLIPVSGHS
jgi:anti-sigma B factor antagonist